MSSTRTSILQKETTPARSHAIKVLFALVRLGVGIGLLVYLAKSGILDLRAVSKLLTAWPITLAAVALLFFDVFLMAARLSWLFRPQFLQLSLRRSLQLTLVGFFFGTFLPGAAGGDFAKLFYATRENKGRQIEIVTVVMFDRVIGFFSMCLLPLLLAPMFPDLIRNAPVLRYLLVTVGLLAMCLVAGFLLCLWKQPILDIFGWKSFRFFRWRSLVIRGLETIQTYRRSPRTLVGALGASMLADVALIGVTALGMLAVNPSGLSMKMCLVIPMGYMANSLPLTPGGLGVGEAAFNALFEITGLHGGAEALLCWRVWSALVGIFGLIIYLRGVKRTIIHTAEVE